MGEEPDLNPSDYEKFFEDHLMIFDPAHLTESGMKSVACHNEMKKFNENFLVLDVLIARSNW